MAMATQKKMVEERHRVVVNELAEKRAAQESEKEVAVAAKVTIEEAYKHMKDSRANFAYIMAFAEAI